MNFHDVVRRCFGSFLLSILDYCARNSATRRHLRIFDRVLKSAALIPLS